MELAVQGKRPTCANCGLLGLRWTVDEGNLLRVLLWMRLWKLGIVRLQSDRTRRNPPDDKEKGPGPKKQRKGTRPASVKEVAIGKAAAVAAKKKVAFADELPLKLPGGSGECPLCGSPGHHRTKCPSRKESGRGNAYSASSPGKPGIRTLRMDLSNYIHRSSKKGGTRDHSYPCSLYGIVH
jgi:hypothetical protein